MKSTVPQDRKSDAPALRWLMARPCTILQAILRTERRLLHDLPADERRDEQDRLAQLRALLRMVR